MATQKVKSVADDLDEMGPIDYLAVEFPGSRITGEAFPRLVDLVDRALVRIDLAFVRKDTDGSAAGLELKDLDGDGELDISLFEGVLRTARPRRCRGGRRA